MTTKTGGQASTEAAGKGGAATAATSTTTTEGKGGTETGTGAATSKAGEGGEQSGKGKEGEGTQSGEQGSGAETGGKDGKGGAPESKAPEKYELSIPDDAKRFIGKEEIEYFENVARASNWSNEDAQAEIDAAIERQKAGITRRIKSWTDETKADEDFGGEALEETTRLGNAAINKVFPEGHRLRDPFLAFLKESGANQKLEVAAFLATVGRLMGEDRTTRRQASSTTKKSGDDGSDFYDHPTSKRVQEEAAAKK